MSHMEPIEPPNYGPQQARFGPRCDSCEFFDDKNSRCKKYSYPVKVYMHCNSWKRNHNLPINVV